MELGGVVGEVAVSRTVHRPNGAGLARISDSKLAHCDVARELCGLEVVGQLGGRHVVHQNVHLHDS